MPRLRGKTCFLVLWREEDFSSSSIAICTTFNEAVQGWGEGSRISPIFAVDGAVPPDLTQHAESWVLFFGPVAPGMVTPVPSPHTFLTLGLYNFVVFSTNRKHRQRALDLSHSLGVRSEEWSLKYDRIDDAAISEEPLPQELKGRPVLTRLPTEILALRAPAREYVLAFASALAKARLFASPFVPDLLRFNRTFRTALADPDMELSDRHKLLVLANTALSRHISQTFGGTSPVLQTECHYASHSLLGIGTASLALLRLRQFLENSLSHCRIIERLNCLKGEPAHGTDLEMMPTTPAFWEREHLFCYPSQTTIPGLDQPPPDDILPLLTCFGGRDGFRSTDVSLSAPLEVVSYCNLARWTPLTLTHEFSHTIIQGFLGALTPDLRTDDEVDQIVGMIRDDHYPNLFLQLRAVFCVAVWELSGGTEREIQSEELADTLERHMRSVNELLTHCFDFLYFYQRNIPAYVQGIWVSWGAIPNIRARIDDYLLRCLCALHTLNLKRDKGEYWTCRQLEENLELTCALFPNAPYVTEALSQLKQDRDSYIEKITARFQLIRIARHILFSETIDRHLWRQHYITSESRGRALFNVLQFNTETVENPLHFLAKVSREGKINHTRAMSILMHLAFSDCNSDDIS